jgi:hypothetical protein
MKSQYLNMLSCFFLIILFLSCGESSIAPDPLEDDSDYSSFELKKAKYSISPSGDVSGTLDADAIQDAINNSQPGDIISLKKGKFYINRTIVSPSGFHGIIRGVSMKNTIIEGVGSASLPFQNTLISNPSYTNIGLVNGSAFFYFEHPSNEISVENMTVQLPDGFETDNGQLSFNNLSYFFAVQLGTDECNTSFKNIRMQGVDENDPGFTFFIDQPYYGIAVMGALDDFPTVKSAGSHIIKNTEFSHIGLWASINQALKDANISFVNNSIKNSKQIIFRLLDGSSINVSNNELDTYSASSIAVTQEGNDIPGNKSEVVIRNNEISSAGLSGIEIGLYGSLEKPDFDLFIENNYIFKEDDITLGFPNTAGIQVSTGEQNAIIRKNTISGNSDYGIQTQTVDNSSFLKNTFTDFTSNIADYRFEDSDNNIICKSGPTTILDQGVGNILQCPK